MTAIDGTSLNAGVARCFQQCGRVRLWKLRRNWNLSLQAQGLPPSFSKNAFDPTGLWWRPLPRRAQLSCNGARRASVSTRSGSLLAKNFLDDTGRELIRQAFLQAMALEDQVAEVHAE